MKFLLIFAAMILSIATFASEKYIPGPDNQMVAKGILTVSIPWVKDKGGKFDLNVSMHDDDNDRGIIVFLSDMSCFRGNLRGELKYTFFNTGERTIDFKPNQKKSFNMVCRVEGKMSGDFKITIAKVYDNPSLDGKTVGKVIAKDLSWSQSDRHN